MRHIGFNKYPTIQRVLSSAFTDEGIFDAEPHIVLPPVEIIVQFADDHGIDAVMRVIQHMNPVSFVDDATLFAILTKMQKLKATFADEATLAATLKRRRNLNVTFLDEATFVAKINASKPPITASIVDFATTTALGTTLTFNSRNYGAENANRYMILYVATSANARTFGNMSLGTTNFTPLLVVDGVARAHGFWYMPFPTGTGGSVVIRISANNNTTHWYLWNVVVPSGTLQGLAGLDGNNENPVVQAGGLVLCGTHSSDLNSTWTYTFGPNTQAETLSQSASSFLKSLVAQRSIISSDVGAGNQMHVQVQNSGNTAFGNLILSIGQ